jgi:site-specific recombinase XerD
MEEFANRNQIKLLRQLNIDDMGEFRNGWKDGALSASKKLERLRAFFGFAAKRNWISESPVLNLRAPKILFKPTMPFTHEEMARILTATDTYREESAANGMENARRLRAFVLILRYTGMRISDVVNLNA